MVAETKVSEVSIPEPPIWHNPDTVPFATEHHDLSTIHHIILPSSSRSSKWTSFKKFLHQNCVCTRVYPKVSELAAWSENCNWYSPLPLSAVVSLFCESVYCIAAITLCVASQRVFIIVAVVQCLIDSVRKLLNTPSYFLPSHQRIHTSSQPNVAFQISLPWRRSVQVMVTYLLYKGQITLAYIRL
jgi:hypothetical protein